MEQLPRVTLCGTRIDPKLERAENQDPGHRRQGHSHWLGLKGSLSLSVEHTGPRVIRVKEIHPSLCSVLHSVFLFCPSSSSVFFFSEHVLIDFSILRSSSIILFSIFHFPFYVHLHVGGSYLWPTIEVGIKYLFAGPPVLPRVSRDCTKRKVDDVCLCSLVFTCVHVM